MIPTSKPVEAIVGSGANGLRLADPLTGASGGAPGGMDIISYTAMLDMLCTLTPRSVDNAAMSATASCNITPALAAVSELAIAVNVSILTLAGETLIMDTSAASSTPYHCASRLWKSS